MLRPLACLKGDPHMLVSSFIDASSATWRRDLLEEYFLPMDCDIIRAIPLSTRRLADCWSWHYEKTGVLSVRSVYRMLVQTKKRREDWLESRPAVSNSAKEGKLWQQLWKIQVPSKLRIFLWRLAHQSLPTGDVRHHRHMADTNACSICGEADSWRHSLLSCTLARCVWALMDESVTEHMCRSEEPSAKQWIFLMMESLSKEDFARISVTLWAIWHARRKVIFDDEFQSPLSTFAFVESYLRDLSISGAVRTKEKGVPASHPKWIPPPPGYEKINVDAAISRTGSGGAVGAVCRSAEGIFLGATTLTVDGISDPTIMEALACREALALAADLNLQKLVVATDCLSVVKSMEQPFSGTYGMIIEEIKLTARNFTHAAFKHENRRSNTEAHLMARSAVASSLGRQAWFLQPPGDLCIPLNIAE
jgi:ribonuclease HI